MKKYILQARYWTPKAYGEDDPLRRSKAEWEDLATYEDDEETAIENFEFISGFEASQRREDSKDPLSWQVRADYRVIVSTPTTVYTLTESVK